MNVICRHIVCGCTCTESVGYVDGRCLDEQAGIKTVSLKIFIFGLCGTVKWINHLFHVFTLSVVNCLKINPKRNVILVFINIEVELSVSMMSKEMTMQVKKIMSWRYQKLMVY